MKNERGDLRALWNTLSKLVTEIIFFLMFRARLTLSKKVYLKYIYKTIAIKMRKISK